MKHDYAGARRAFLEALELVVHLERILARRDDARAEAWRRKPIPPLLGRRGGARSVGAQGRHELIRRSSGPVRVIIM